MRFECGICLNKSYKLFTTANRKNVIHQTITCYLEQNIPSVYLNMSKETKQLSQQISHCLHGM